MSTYLVIKNGTETKKYKCESSAPKPYIQVMDKYIPLTTVTHTGMNLKVKDNNNNIYIPTNQQTVTTSSAYIKLELLSSNSDAITSKSFTGTSYRGHYHSMYSRKTISSYYSKTADGEWEYFGLITTANSTIYDDYELYYSSYSTTNAGTKSSRLHSSFVTTMSRQDTLYTSYSRWYTGAAKYSYYTVSTAILKRSAYESLSTDPQKILSTVEGLLYTTAGTGATRTSTSSNASYSYSTTWTAITGLTVCPATYGYVTSSEQNFTAGYYESLTYMTTLK